MLCQPRQAHHARRRRAANANLPERFPVHAGKDGHSEQLWARLSATGLGQSLGPSAHHGQATSGVKVEQSDVGQAACGGNGAGYGVGNVVVLEIEENVGSEAADLAYRVRSCGGEEMNVDLEQAHGAGKQLSHFERFIQPLDVQSDNEFAAGCGV